MADKEGIGARPAYIKDKKPVEMDASNDLRMKELAVQLMEAKAKKKAAAEAEAAANKEIDAIDEELSQMMVTRGVDLFRINGIGTFFTQDINYPSVSNQDAFIEWLDTEGMGAIAKRTVHPQTLKGWVNDRLKEGQSISPYVNNFIKTRVSTRKA